MYDAVIIGAGTAGMTAGIYLARRGMDAVILESDTYGGQIINSREIENYPGIKSVSGFDFATGLYEQTLSLGGDIRPGRVSGINTGSGYMTVLTDDGEYDCKKVIIASGAKNRPLGLRGEDELIGRGISYCANCDGAFFKNKTVAVVGGGNTALDDAEFLAGICERVYLIHRRDEFRGDSVTVEALRQRSNVEFVLSKTVTSLKKGANGSLEAVTVTGGGSETELNVSGLFVAVGQVPNTDFVRGVVETDPSGYIVAGEDCRTSVPGIYAAGDCRTKSLRQLVTAAADGAAAASAV
ncbi:MAG TPA: FAD-dependent oxidoreductase [Candidatus Monoglobus merdigallinarum]|uniref:FAD-dependent oxidoreductase n=1 Tax=Candidatus Monoglobus merdigallinarum TaxID=2838698 RepID=A0A9D1PR28_9FIRM|nr:FAD-dependent oxidoreductase [Candidatus Monoglobus merdigallinarum]